MKEQVKPFLIVVFNIAIFILIRYVNIISIFLKGGFGNNYVDSDWKYFPAYLFQVIVLLVLIVYKFKKGSKRASYIYLICILVITLLFVLSKYGIVSDSIIPQ